LGVGAGWWTGGLCGAAAGVGRSRVTPTATKTNAAVKRLAPRPRTCVLDIAPRDDPLADTPVLRLAQPNVCVGWPQALLMLEAGVAVGPNVTSWKCQPFFGAQRPLSAGGRFGRPDCPDGQPDQMPGK